MSINTIPTAPVTVNGEPLEFVQDFTYLGSLISKDNGGQKDIKARLGKARCPFAKLQNIWKSNQYTTKTKIRLYNSNVKSILLYGSECWRLVKGDMAKIDAFHNRCIRKICRIFLPNNISNVDLYKKTSCNSAVLEIKRRRLRWLGHVLRMPQDSIPKVALRWTPPGKRKRGRPKMTWRQSVMAELKEMGLSWGEAQASAKDRTLWRSIVVALCPTGDEEDNKRPLRQQDVGYKLYHTCDTAIGTQGNIISELSPQEKRSRIAFKLMKRLFSLVVGDIIHDERTLHVKVL
ncbi:hypothetical protein NP493_821g01017 [Ridgeia piscesae]|uniref:DUF6451 domain-containing protein n=1 Tax=Ridgeia piscesae TaxID=27915 RepID=A0AAD9KMM4_RIDPI|nr:hypothetical protein NP493_821g01017 [Ridgeia piscesae]